MLPAGKRRKQAAQKKLLPQENRSAAADTMNAEPPDAQQEQSTTTENYARAEALRRAFYPCIVFRRRAILPMRRASAPARIGQKRTRMPMICFARICVVYLPIM
jgi:hypothetical protein